MHHAVNFLVGCGHAAITATFVLLLLYTFNVAHIGGLFFPSFSCGRFIIRYFCPSTTSTGGMQRELLRVDRGLSRGPSVRHITMDRKDTPTCCYLMHPVASNNSYCNRLVVSYGSCRAIIGRVPRMQQRLHRTFPSTCVHVHGCGFSVSADRAIRIRFTNPSPTMLHSLDTRTRSVVHQSPCISTCSIRGG